MQAIALESEFDLIMRVQSGEPECMGPLLEAHRTRVVHYLHRMVQNQAAAEELAQEVFLRAYRARATYEHSAKFTAWIYRIATNLALNWRRHRSYEGYQQSLDDIEPGERRRELLDRRPTIDQIIITEESLDEIRRAIAALPPRQRAVILMHKYEGMEYREIAQALACSVPTVKSLVFRAYATLRITLGHMSDGRVS